MILPSFRRRVLATGLVGLAVAATLTGASRASTPTSHGVPKPRPAAPTRVDVTLITGDVVTVVSTGDGHQAVTVRRPAGAIGGVQTYTAKGHTYVIPDEAMPFVAAKTVDRRLFDVTGLIADGYDDAHSAGVPLLLATGGAAPILPTGIRTTRTLRSIKGAAVDSPKSRTRALWTSLATPAKTRALAPGGALGAGVTRVYLDGKVHVTMAQSNAQIGTAAAWAAGYDGTGVKVAVLDTGYDTDHPDLVNRVSAAQSFVPGETIEDGNEHGTHTLSTVGGSGAASGGQEKGVAPGADLMVGKVLSDAGYGQDSWILAGMEWAAHSGARVISMSLGSTEPFDGTDVESVAVDQLTAETGTLFVVAAGNSGCEGCIGTPGSADAAITVGAVDSQDQLAWFSSLGPRYGDYGMKPDIVAPGVGILAAKMGGDAETGWYQELDGTSMATPHVAGVAALLLQEHPDWKAPQVKDAIMSTALALPGYTAYQVGAGRVSVPAAIAATVTATGSQYFGFFGWPHTADADVDRAVTFTNTGDAAVTLHLTESAQVAGGPYDVFGDPSVPVGDAAPDGMFTLSAGAVTVPAHGTASVTARAKPSMGTPGTRYLGQILATDDGGTLRTHTNVGLYLEDQRYDLDIALKDRAGRPMAGTVVYQKLGTGDFEFVDVDETGKAKVRWRGGTYEVFTFADVQGDHGKDSLGLALLGDPEFTLDRNRSLTFDARRAVRTTAAVPAKTEARFRQMEWYRNVAGVPDDSTYLVPDRYDDLYVLPTRRVTTGDFEYTTRWRLAQPELTVTDAGKQLYLQNQVGGGFLSGTRTFAAAYAGTSAAPALGPVKGKAAVVKVVGDFDAGALVARAVAAGAKMVILANTLGGKLYTWVGTPDGTDQPIPVVSMPTSDATKFLARVVRGGVTLTATGIENTAFVYDLQDPHAGYVPTHLTYQPAASSLAVVTMKFYGTVATSGGEFRWDYRPFRTSEFAFAERQNMPGTRVDYVSTEAGTGWFEDTFTGPEQGLESRGPGIVSYRPGQRVTRDWFSPVVAPRNGTGFWTSYRDPYAVYVNLQPWSDGGAGTGGYIEGDAGTVDLKVLRDGVLLKEESLYASTWLDVSTDTGPSAFTFDLTATRSPAYWPTSTGTHTVWTVRSTPVTDGDNHLIPVMQIAYRVRTDLAGRAAGGAQSLGLDAYFLPGTDGTGRIGKPRMQVSFDDGVTWKTVTVTKSATGWVANFHAPTSGYVSLRTTAGDNAGNTIDQTVIRAYGLK